MILNLTYTVPRRAERLSARLARRTGFLIAH
jgi:hypothetical protein